MPDIRFPSWMLQLPLKSSYRLLLVTIYHLVDEGRDSPVVRNSCPAPGWGSARSPTD